MDEINQADRDYFFFGEAPGSPHNETREDGSIQTCSTDDIGKIVVVTGLKERKRRAKVVDYNQDTGGLIVKYQDTGRIEEVHPAFDEFRWGVLRNIRQITVWKLGYKRLHTAEATFTHKIRCRKGTRRPPTPPSEPLVSPFHKTGMSRYSSYAQQRAQEMMSAREELRRKRSGRIGNFEDPVNLITPSKEFERHKKRKMRRQRCGAPKDEVIEIDSPDQDARPPPGMYPQNPGYGYNMQQHQAAANVILIYIKVPLKIKEGIEGHIQRGNYGQDVASLQVQHLERINLIHRNQIQQHNHVWATCMAFASSKIQVQVEVEGIALGPKRVACFKIRLATVGQPMGSSDNLVVTGIPHMCARTAQGVSEHECVGLLKRLFSKDLNANPGEGYASIQKFQFSSHIELYKDPNAPKPAAPAAPPMSMGMAPMGMSHGHVPMMPYLMPPGGYGSMMPPMPPPVGMMPGMMGGGVPPSPLPPPTMLSKPY